MNQKVYVWILAKSVSIEWAMNRKYLLLCVRCIETNMLKYTIQNAQGTPTNGKIHSTEEVWVRKPL